MQIRSDRTLDRTVLISPGRAARPHNFAPSAWPDVPPEACPFCRGNEAQTPHSVDQRLDADGQWQVRVVPNKYPILSPGPSDSAAARAQMPADVGVGVATGAGGHEVIVESPKHLRLVSQLTPGELAVVLEIYARRLRAWRERGGYEYGLIFKNLGAAAGASLVHLHSQLMVLEELPPAERRAQTRLEEFTRTTGQCAFCQQLAEESRIGTRVIAEAGDLIAYCPFVSLYPYETWILPRTHAADFEEVLETGTESLACCLHAVLSSLERLAGGIGYNLIVRTAPWSAAGSRACHWRIEILPRLSALAGLELATDLRVNHVEPEQAAAELRVGAP